MDHGHLTPDFGNITVPAIVPYSVCRVANDRLRDNSLWAGIGNASLQQFQVEIRASKSRVRAGLEGRSFGFGVQTVDNWVEVRLFRLSSFSGRESADGLTE